MEDKDFPIGQRSPSERRGYVDAAIKMMVKQEHVISLETELLLDRFVEGEMTLREIIAELDKHKTH